MNRHYDAAIVGAGPAGAVFAAELAKKRPDLRILLINGQSETNSKPCGGLLAPDAQKLLAEADMTLPNSILADPQIFAVETIDLEAKCVRYYQRCYLNMNRYAFDRWLLSMVPNSVGIVDGRCTAIKKDADGFTLTVSDRIFTADSVIGADGAGSIVRRSFFERMPKQYVSIQEWYPSRGEKIPYYSCIFDPETSDSCSWIIHKDGCVIFGGAFEKHGCREAFARQKERLETFLGSRFGEPQKREACLVTSPRSMRDLVPGGDRVYLLGEAAGFISASSFEGISSAIKSGRLLAQAFSEGGSHEKILKRYKKLTGKLRIRLFSKTFKRLILTTPASRGLIMQSGIQSIGVKEERSAVQPYHFRKDVPYAAYDN